MYRCVVNCLGKALLYIHALCYIYIQREREIRISFDTGDWYMADKVISLGRAWPMRKI